MKPQQIDECYRAVMREAESSFQNHSRHGIRELLEKPTFSGFIEVSFLKNVSVSMFVCENDDGVALRCFWNKAFEPMSIAVWASLVDQTSCAFDVGAHSGLYSLVAHAVSASVTVVSIEPYPLNFSRLVLNLQANKFPVNKVINAAASDTSGVVPFVVSTRPGYLTSGGSVLSQSGGGKIPVPCVSLDNITTRNGLKPGLVKIDVEGHEFKVLEGGVSLLDQCSPDLLIESVFSGDTDQIEGMLKQRGYSFYVIDDDAMTLEKIDHLRPASHDGNHTKQANRFVTKRGSNAILEIVNGARALLDL